MKRSAFHFGINRIYELLLVVCLFPWGAMAQTGPASLNLSGGLFNPNGTAIADTSVNFKIDIYDANANCLLYSEEHLGQNLSQTKGGFSLQLGAGTSQVNYLESSTAFDKTLFKNSGAVAAFTGCPSGVTFNAGDSRVIRVSYDVGQGFITMTPDVPITSTPYAMVADTLQGLPASGFVQTDGASLIQANVANIFSNINYPKLEALLSGTSTQYIPSAPGSSVSFNGQLLTNIADPTMAQDAATKNYADRDLGGLPITIAGIGPGMGNGKTLVWDQAASAWVAQTAGTVTYVGAGTGLVGGNITSQGTLAVDVGTSAGKILQLTAAAQLPGVDGSLLLNVNATRLASQVVSTIAPSFGQILGWNASSSQWEPQLNAGITALTGDVHATGPGSASATIQPNAVNLASKINNGGNGPNQLLITDPTTGTTIGYGTCAIAGQVYQWTASGWACVSVTTLLGNSSVSAGTYGSMTMIPQITVDSTGRVIALTNVNINYPVTSVNGKTGVVVLNGADLGLGTASTQNYGSAAGDLVQLDTNGLIPIGELPSSTGTITGVIAGTALLGGGTSGLVTLSVDVGVTANQIMQFNAQAQYPGNDGALITNVNATRIGTRTVSTATPVGGQVLGWNTTNGDWEPASVTSGTVSSISSGTGLTGGPIATNGTLNVDVGTAANKILQVTSSGLYPADDGSLISNLNATRIGTRTISTSTPVGGQVLGWNTTNGDWEPASASAGTVTSVSSGTGLTGGPIATTGTLNVDVGTAANKILQVTSTGVYPEDDGYLISNLNATSLSGKPLSLSNATAGQVLTYNGTLGKWDAETSNALTGFVNGGNSFGSAATLGTNDNNSLAFKTNNSAAMTILANGNVGIGTTTPVGLLNVFNNSAALTSGQTTLVLNAFHDGTTPVVGSGAKINFKQGTGTDTAAIRSYTFGPSLTGLSFDTGWGALTSKMVIDNSGNVGIGTNAPAAALDVMPTGTSGDLQVLASGFSNQVKLQAGAGGAGTSIRFGSTLIGDSSASNLGSSTNYWNAAYITNGYFSANVGIGTAAPAAMLDIYGLGTGRSAIIVPRDTVANRPSTPVNGMIRYASDTGKFEVYQSGSWQNMIAATNGTLTSLTGGTGLIGGTVSSIGTLSVDVGTAANKILQVTSTGLYPSDDGSLISNLNATRIGTRAVSTNGPGAGQVLGWNTTNSDWEPTAASTGSVQSVVSGTGLVASTITQNGTLAVDVGTAANKILQVTSAGVYPQDDGYLISNINATSLAGKQVSLSSATAGQVLTYNGTLNKWDAETSNAATGFVNGGNSFGSAATLGTNDNNTLAFKTSNSVAMTILTNGFVGIGTANPYFKLQAYGVDGGAYSPTSSSMQFPGSGAATAFIQNDGYTDGEGSYLAFQAKNSVYNAEIAYVGAISNPGISNSAPSIVFGQRVGANSTNSYAERLRIDQNGNVGIGTSAPAAILDVYGLLSQSAIIVPRDTVASRPSVPVNGMIRYASDTAKFEVYQNGSWLNMIAATNGTLTSLTGGAGLLGGTISSVGTLTVDVGTAANKILQVTSAGVYPHVDGYAITNINATNLAGKPLASSGATAGQVLTYNGTLNEWDAETSIATTGFVNGGNSFGSAASLGTKDNNSLAFITNNSAALTILTSGYVGIGTTNPTSPLYVNGTITSQSGFNLTNGTSSQGGLYNDFGHGRLYVSDNNGTTQINLGPFNPGQANYMALGTGLFLGGTSTAKSQLDINGNLTLGSGYAGVTAAPNNGMIVQGSVGVGTASPMAALDVYGTGTASSAMIVPRDTVANRPSSPVNGMIRYASDTGKFEGYQSGTWQNMLGGAASSLAFNNLTAATATGSLDNTNFAQTWNWSTAGTQTALTMIGNSLTTGGLVQLQSSSNNLSSTNGLLDVANTGTNTNGVLATFQANSTAGSGMTIQQSGMVGIGTSAPTAQLEVDGAATNGGAMNIVDNSTSTGNLTLNIVQGSLGNPTMSFVKAGSRRWIVGMDSSDASKFKITSTASTYTFTNAPFVIDTNNQVGIGTYAPASVLDVWGAGNTSALIVPRDATASRPSSPINGMIRYATDTAKFEVYQNGTWQNMIAATNGTLTSLTAGSGLLGGTITSVGTLSVDVGTAANKILQLTSTGVYPQGDGSLISNINATSLGGKQVSFSGATAGQVLTYNGTLNKWDAETSIATTGFINGGNYFGTATSLGTKDNNSLSILTNNTTALTVLPSGYVGIGTTNPNTAFEVYGGSANGPGAQILLASPLNNAASAVIYSLATSNKQVDLGLGAPSGDNNLTDKFYMNDTVGGIRWVTDLQTGNFGINTSVPQSKLDVNGNVAIGTFAGTNVAPTNGMIVSGAMGVGTALPASMLDIYGLGTGASAMIVPRDTVANRPSSPVNGMIRYASDTGKFEGYQSGTWTNLITGASSGSALSNITAATAANTIDNATFAQTWNWSSATSQSPLSINANNLTTGSVLTLTSASSALNSTSGLLDVANTSTSTSGILAQFQSNSTAGSGLYVLANGRVGIGTAAPAEAIEMDGALRVAAPTTFTAGGYTGSLSAGATASMYASSTVGFPSSGVLWIDSEAIAYTGKTANNFTGLTRGILGTTAQAHSGSYIHGSTLNVLSGGTYALSVMNDGSLQTGSSVASGIKSVALGYGSSATGSTTVALGNASTANGYGAVAIGNSPVASGSTSTAIGLGVSSPAYGEVALGQFSQNTGTENAGTFIATDPLLVVGNGISGATSNAMMILKNASTGIGTSAPAAMLDVYGLGTAQSAMIVPRDTTANRPTGVVNGMIRYATDTAKFEVYQNGTWQNMIASTNGTVTSVQGGTGLVNTNITSTGTLAVDVGTAANKILQVTSTGVYPADDGYLISNINAGSIGGKSLNLASATAGQVLTYNGTLGKWDAETSINSIGFVNGGNSFGAPATLGTKDANSLSLITGNSSVLTLLANGNVGIGTTSPSALFQIYGASNQDLRITKDGLGIFLGATNDAGSGQIPLYMAGQPIDFNTGGFDTMTLNNGNVGIGSTTPAGKLDVEGSGGVIFNAGNVGIGTNIPAAMLDIYGLGTGQSAMIVPRDSTANRPTSPVNGMIRYASDTGKFEAYQSGTWTNLITAASGNTAALSNITAAIAANTIDNTNFAQTWNWSSATTQNLLTSNANSLTTGSMLALKTTSTNLNSTSGLLDIENNSTATSGLIARIQANNAVGSGVTVLANGNVGIGTTVPSAQLSNNGNGTVDSTTVGTGLTALNWSANSNGYVASFYNAGLTGSPNGVLIKGALNGSNALLSVDNGSSQATAGVPVFRVLGNGNVGIGTTSPSVPLQVEGKIQSDSSNQYSVFELSHNGTGRTQWAWDETHSISYIQTDSSTYDIGLSPNYTNRFIVKASTGYVGIGSTAPAGFLDVEGSGNILLNAGNVGVGTNNPQNNLDIQDSDNSTAVNIQNNHSDFRYFPQLNLTNYAGNNAGFEGGNGLVNFIEYRGSSDAPAPPQTGDQIGQIQAFGGLDSNPNDISAGAQISFIADGNFSSSSAPESITFATAPVGSLTALERMRISNSGLVGIGTTSPGMPLDVLGSGGNSANFANTGSTSWAYFRTFGGTPVVLGAGNAAGDFQVQTGGSGRMTISASTGNTTFSNAVGVGTTNPGAPLDVNGHIANSATGAPSVSTTCGVSVSVTGNDTRGTVTLATATNNCTVTINFSSTYVSAPYCVLTAVSAGTYTTQTPGINTVSTSALVVDMTSVIQARVNYANAPAMFNYMCMQ